MASHISKIIRAENVLACIQAGLMLEAHSLIMVGPAHTKTLDYRLDFKFLNTENADLFFNWHEDPADAPGPMRAYQWSKFVRKSSALILLDMAHNRVQSNYGLEIIHKLLITAAEMGIIAAEEGIAVTRRMMEDAQREAQALETRQALPEPEGE